MKLTRLIAWIGLAAFCVAIAIAQAPVITGVKPIGLNISNLDRSVDFDTHVLKFSPNSSRAASRSSVRERLFCSPSSGGHLIDAVNSKSGQVFNGQGR